MSDVDLANMSDAELEALFGGAGAAPADTVVVQSYASKKPHWVLKSGELKKVLQIVRAFPAVSSVVLAMWREEDHVCFHANNRDAFIDARLKIQNPNYYVGNAGSESRVYFLDSEILLAFLNSYPDFALAFDKDTGDVFFESANANHKLVSLALNLGELRIVAEPPANPLAFPLTKAELSVFHTLFNHALKLSDSRMLLTGDKAEAFFSLYKFTVTGIGNWDNVVIRRLDINALREIADFSDVSMYCTESRLYFLFPYGTLSFERVPYDEQSFMYPETMADGAPVGAFNMDLKLLKQALKLVSLLGSGEVVFQQGDGGVIQMLAGGTSFNIGSGQLASPFSLGTELFGKLISTMVTPTVLTQVAERGIDFGFNGPAHPMLYSLSRVSLAQIRVGSD